MKTLDIIAVILLIVGGLNRGLAGVTHFVSSPQSSA